MRTKNKGRRGKKELWMEATQDGNEQHKNHNYFIMKMHKTEGKLIRILKNRLLRY